MVTLRVFLLDLLTLVDDGARKWVLLPNAVNRGRTPDDLVEPHFPMLLFEREDLNGGDWPELKRRLLLRGRRPGTAWLLDREEILFPEPAREGFPEEVDGDAAGPLPDAGNARSLSWMPRMSDFAPAPGSARVDPACLVERPVRSPKIVARALLTGGTIRTAAFTKVRSDRRAVGDILPFQFRVDPRSRPRGPVKAMADRLVVEIPVAGESVRIRTAPFNERQGRRVGRSIELWPNEQGIVNVLLANVSPATPNFNAREAGLHFHAYYELAEKPLPSNERTIPFVLRNGHPSVNPLQVELDLPATFQDAFRNPIGVFENRICTTARMTA